MVVGDVLVKKMTDFQTLKQCVAYKHVNSLDVINRTCKEAVDKRNNALKDCEGDQVMQESKENDEREEHKVFNGREFHNVDSSLHTEDRILLFDETGAKAEENEKEINQINDKN